ncbi:NAD(P)H-dependent oxidoreductase, partial [Acinetobacter colistiniresistens]|uniref:NAD(P)H-dependent oxidoreductase n=1 Tax=Acinetobacter colistiniresistens TaxID=280145 RepID=UPI001D17E1F5
ERHGSMSSIFKSQIDWIPLAGGAIRATQGKTLALMQVSGGSQAEPELLQLHEQLAIEKLQELARYDLVGEVRRAIGSTLESGE